MALACLVASGCAVGVDAPDVSSSTRKACAGLVRALPERVGDQRRRDVDDDQQGAAWGDPAIVLRCGVGTPRGFTRFSTCQETDGLGWFVPDDQMGTSPRPITMTTIGRSPRVEVKVPKDYWPPAGVMVDLTRAVKAHTKQTGTCR